MSFKEKLHQATNRNNSLVCVGLDTDPTKLPACVQGKDDPVLYFNQQIIDATADLVCCYKPNFAFYGALGAHGFTTLQQTMAHVPNPVPVLVDAKVGDIGNTAEQYAHKFFDVLGADALTVTPYMGTDAVTPFTAYKDCTTFLVCLTSNPGADDFEKQPMGDRRLYEHVIAKAHEWNTGDNIGLVIGGTQPEHFASVRALAPDMPFLIPGIGAQGGDIETAVKNGQDEQGAGILLNSSRGILYASSGEDFAEAARTATLQLRDAINEHRSI
ncbi:MAG TPA: orotidine-5'-phosphate decarboxylase [Candidatus Handelsmanbacteria bacterium]|nr:orotidine-5'-phosphate decarboxylase [Candidatus Handelsmanbacteria bacterium]